MKRIRVFIILILVIFSFSACNKNTNLAGDDSVNVISPVYPKSIAFDDNTGKKNLENNNSLDNNFVRSINYFTSNSTSKILSDQSNNVCYSPVSLYFALSLAASGANGETQSQMFSVLGLAQNDKNYLDTQISSLYRLLYLDNDIGKLKIANSLWMSKGQSFKKDYIKAATENFYSSLYNVDFNNKNTAEQMSRWISDNTSGILSPKIQLDQNQIMSIFNTIYFKDEWLDLFDNTKTKKDVFNLSNGTKTDCDFMNTIYNSHSYTKGDGFISSSLYLKNDETMTFVLPDKGKNINDLVSSSEKVDSILLSKNDSCREVIFKIPKFSLGSDLELKSYLQLLGMRAAFDKNADFTGITDGIAFISGIKQQSKISIDEKGVEAAAFTQILYAGSAPPNSNIAEIILDRPFMYFIKSANGTVLFVGIVNNPVQ